MEMRQKIIATGIALTLVLLAAVGAFASQDAVHTLADPTVTPSVTDTPVDTTATSTPAATDTPAGVATDTATPGAAATSTPTPGTTGTPQATDTPEPTTTGTPDATGTPSDGDDDGDRDIKGIPTSNPSHRDDDGDGTCEKGETEVKTTPSGNQVRAPCQAVKDGEHGAPANGKHGADDGSGQDDN